MKLYELASEYLQLLNMAEDGEIEAKADGIAKIMQKLDADIAELDAEIKRLKERKDAVEQNKENLKAYLFKSLKAINKPSFKTLLFSYTIAKNPAAVILDENLDIKKVPVKYRTVPQPTFNKKAIKEALNNGIKLKWARLEQSESLRIK